MSHDAKLGRPQDEEEVLDPLIGAVLTASRVLVAVAARSLIGLEEEVTLAQYRTMVVLASRGPQSVGALAETLGVNASTATRMCDRLVAKHLVRRRRTSSNRRAVRVALTQPGHDLLRAVTRRRRSEIAQILGRLPTEDRHQVVTALRALAEAAGEVPEQDWSLGWGTGSAEDPDGPDGGARP